MIPQPIIFTFLLVSIALLQSAGASIPNSQEDRQQSLTAQLSAGGDEQRFDAAAQLVVLFNAYPNSSTAQTFGALTRALQSDGSALVRALSARALENCCGQQAIQPLLASLTSERQVAVRKAILYALAAHRAPQTTSALIPLLNDKNQEVRAATAYALAEIGDPASASALVAMLQRRRGDEDAFARSQAARGLGKIGNHTAKDVLLDSLVRDKSQEVRREAARALGLLANKQDAQVIEALENARLQSDPYLAAIAGAALEGIQSRER
jgi:HEAT repeat protein